MDGITRCGITPRGSRVRVRQRRRAARSSFWRPRHRPGASSPQLFRPFAQKEGVGHRTEMGLGLRIAAYVVSLDGGSIAAAGHGERTGARLTVLVPACGGPPAICDDAGGPAAAQRLRAEPKPDAAEV